MTKTVQVEITIVALIWNKCGARVCLIPVVVPASKYVTFPLDKLTV